MNGEQRSAALKAVDGFLKSRGVHLGAVSTLDLVELMGVALATQSPQDERTAPASTWQDVEVAVPEQPVALSTLTDEQIDVITTNIWGSQLGVMYPAFREYARDILAAASAPAQQAGQSEPDRDWWNKS